MYQFELKPYYDSVRQCYKQIITVFPKPQGALAKITKQLSPTRLSPFKNFSDCDPYPRCFYAVVNPHNSCDLLRIQDLPLLFDFFNKNNYKIDTQVTKIMMKANTPIDKNLLFYVN